MSTPRHFVIGGCLAVAAACLLILFSRSYHDLKQQVADEKKLADSLRVEARETRLALNDARRNLEESLLREQRVDEDNEFLLERIQKAKDSPHPLARQQKVSFDVLLARLTRARELAGSGQHAAALAEYLWCYDEGGMDGIGVRLSVVLQEAAKLMDQHPEARAALLLRRDRARQELLADPNATTPVAEFAAINRALGDSKTTIALFDQLAQDDKRRARLAGGAFDELVAQGRYADALVGRDASMLISNFDRRRDFYDNPNQKLTETQLTARKAETIADGMQSLNVILRGDGSASAAQRLADKILAFDPSSETRAKLQEMARAAGKSIRLTP